MTQTRTETDSIGPIEVPASAYWGAQTERSLAAFGAVLAAILLYLFALVLAAMVVTKLLFPGHVGLWRLPQQSAFGIFADPPAGPEMMGLWVLPVALAGALACYALGTLALRRTGRHLLRRATA